MKESIFEILRDRKHLQALAGEKSFARGVGYFEDGMVRSMVMHAERLGATVEGTEVYHVELWLESGALNFSCTCPVNDNGDFCKHCVAVALRYTEAITSPETSDDEEDDEDEWFDDDDSWGGHKPKLQTLDDVQQYLDKLSKGQLAELLLQVAFESDEWRARLKQAAQGLSS